MPARGVGVVKRKVQDIANQLARTVAQWDSVEVIALGEAAQIETFDPFFAIDIDVYHRGNLISAEDRRERLEDPPAFESLHQATVDSFLQDDLPVRIQYTDIARIELNLTRVEESRWAYRETGTNVFYRIQHAQPLHQKSDWLAATRTRLESAPEDFWEYMRITSRAAVERALQDLGAAVYREDNIYFVFSFSAFVRSLCAFLFASNRQFEPNGRLLTEQIAGLEHLPSEFAGRFENLLRQRSPLEPEQKREIAELLARSIIAL